MALAAMPWTLTVPPENGVPPRGLIPPGSPNVFRLGYALVEGVRGDRIANSLRGGRRIKDPEPSAKHGVLRQTPGPANARGEIVFVGLD